MSTRAEKEEIRQYKSQRMLHGIAVTYRRGEDSNDSLKILRGSTRTTVEDSQTRVQLRSSVVNFLILASELEIDDTQIHPEPGDEIELADGSIYEVVRELAGEPAWRWSGDAKVVMRVHVQLASGT